MRNCVDVGGIRFGPDQPLGWILGPCVIESRDLTLRIAEQLRGIATREGIGVVFKASFDKANRTSGQSFRGLGQDEGLRILEAVRREWAFPVTTDVHESGQVAAVAEVVDLLQIPAFLARQTDLLLAAGRTGKPVNVKKGQFMAPWEMKHVVAKLESVGNRQVLLTERGTTFGYGQLVNDLRSIVWMGDCGRPVIFDATHSVQQPAGLGDRTGGERRMIPYLARAAVAAGCDGLFLETHPDPDQSPSDGPNMWPIARLPDLIRSCLRIHRALRADHPLRD